MSTRRRVVAATASCVALLATAACGSTVAMRTAVSSQAQDGLTAGQPGSLEPGQSPMPGSSTLTPAGTTGSGPAAPSSASTAAPGAAVPGGGGVVPGARQPVVVGVITSGNAGGLAGSLGVKLSFGDQRAQARLVADYINAHGGVAGHPIKLVYYDYDVSQGNPGNAEAACAAFTQDAHVFAAVGVAGMDDAYHACAAKRGMLVLSDGDEKATSFFRRFPTTIEVSDMDLTRKYHAMVLALQGLGFFGSGAKVGLVYQDEPNDLEAIRDGMRPALSSIGIRPTDEVAVSHTDSSQSVSQMSSAILKFRAEGVTHVLFGTASGWTFVQAAEKQGYYPKYGLDSRQSPGLLMQSVNQPQSLVNVTGIGYQPVQDVDGAHDPGPVSSHQRLCQKLFDDAGQSSSSTRLTLATSLYLCDELFFLHDAFAGAPDVSRASFLSGVARLGTTYGSSLTFTTRFSATQHDGAQGWRPLRYFTDCDCFRYVGPLHLFP